MRCDGTEKKGNELYIDFYNITPPCTCSVIPYYEGEMLVSSGKIGQPCNTSIKIKDSSNNFYTINCSPQQLPIAVNTCQSAIVKLEFTTNNQGKSYYCLGFQQKITDVIVGSSTFGGLIFFALSSLIMACLIRRRNKGRRDTPPTGELTTEHGNDYVFDRNLPDNPLYHSNQFLDEVGYSTVQDQTIDLQSPTIRSVDQESAVYAKPVKNKMTTGNVTEIPVYAILTKPKNKPLGVSDLAVYAQVNKPQRDNEQNPVQRQNQDCLVYTDVDHNSVLEGQDL
ncbi:uncharacterized protein LOC133177202 [Saccostrea echinata]|uniref:uncharacterized protein LOC133177202 n=1 Tax=Saccostrea echinata TaxID=191078 RepID=UPI002A83F5BC|nr:uncharacterized protein LOC133177202 [Saccostrea echinata]